MTIHRSGRHWCITDDLPTVRHNISALLKREASQYRIEYRLIRRSGEVIWILDKGQATEVDGNGNVCRIVGTVQDITTHKQAQRLLEDSEAHFRMLFQNHGAVMILIDPEQGCIVDANPSAERFYGYSHQELVGMPLCRINQMAEERIHGTIGVALLQAHNHFTFTHRLASGELRTVDVHSSPVESGGRTLLFSIIHDITARREAEEALATLQRQLLAIIEHFHGAMLLEDQSGEVVLVNHQYCEMFMPDLTPEQLKRTTACAWQPCGFLFCPATAADAAAGRVAADAAGGAGRGMGIARRPHTGARPCAHLCGGAAAQCAVGIP
jgi:PAS domain S-box-containing protein